MAFTRRTLFGLSEFKQWITNSFSTKTHGHSDLNNMITQLRKDLDALDPIGAMPDFTRTKVIAIPDGSYAVNPGTIFKINVPGYILEITNYGHFETTECDFFYKFAAHPGYLYRRTDHNTSIGSYPRPTYADSRCALYGDVEGSYFSQDGYAILPGTSTYMTMNDASTRKPSKLCYVPCKSVPTSINTDDFVTAVSRTEQHLSTEGYIGTVDVLGSSIFAGNWKDNFDSKWKLVDSNVKRFDPGFMFVGNFWNGYRFHNLDPMLSGTNRMFYRYPDASVVLKYITSSEVNSIIADLTETQKNTALNSGRTVLQQAQLMANKWCVVHYSYPTYNGYNKVVYTYCIAKNNGNAIFNGGIDTARPGTGESDLWYHTHHFYGSYYASVHKTNYSTGYYIDPATGNDTTTRYTY